MTAPGSSSSDWGGANQYLTLRDRQYREAVEPAVLEDVAGRRGAEEEALAEARGLAEIAGDKALQGRVERKTGVLRYITGQYEEARFHHERDLAIAREIGDRHAEGKATGNLGTVL